MLEFYRVGARELGLPHHFLGDVEITQMIVAGFGNHVTGVRRADLAASYVDLGACSHKAWLQNRPQSGRGGGRTIARRFPHANGFAAARKRPVMMKFCFNSLQSAFDIWSPAPLLSLPVSCVVHAVNVKLGVHGVK
jgi:hypothetical protein